MCAARLDEGVGVHRLRSLYAPHVVVKDARCRVAVERIDGCFVQPSHRSAKVVLQPTEEVKLP